MSNPRIAESTGAIDKRCINGNNGTRRGKDKKPRKAPPRWVLKPEVKAGLKARFDQVLEFYGGIGSMARALKVPYVTVRNAYKLRGMISPELARRVQYHRKMNGFVGFTAAFCRPDLDFDTNGRAKSTKCTKKHMMEYKRKEHD